MSNHAHPAPDRLLSPDCSQVSREVFNSGAVYQAEQKRIFERNWLYLAHESQLRQPGDFVSAYMGEVPVIVAMGSDGKIAARAQGVPGRGAEDGGGWGVAAAGEDQGHGAGAYPNLSLLWGHSTLRVSRPRAPGKIEYWSWWLTPVEAPDHIRALLRSKYNLISRVGQFYYREARLLDERCFQQWLAPVDEGMKYSIPARYTPQPDSRNQDTEEFLAVDRELERAESPPPRTRRFISNIEVERLDDNEYRAYSNFQMFYSHHGADNHTYTGGRRDVLKEVDGQFRICKREVIIDWDVITVLTLALIF